MLNRDLQRHVGKYYGKYSGVVVENDDDEHRGRLRVRVESVLGDAVVRARPCVPSGHFVIPDPGAQVWVEFEAGDPRFAIWVGTWYADGETPDEAQVDPPSHRVIHTPSGHVVELSDEEGEEKIVIRHKSDSFLAIGADGSVTISNQAGAHLHLNSDAEETTLMSQQGHLVTMTPDALVLVNDGGSVFELKGDTASVLAKNIVLSGSSVAAGANASDPTIMGTAFKALWQAVMLHTHPTAMGPSGPPGPPGPVILPLLDGVHLSSSVVVK
ncbi:MAG: phage baseplate assembly protein V [Planctomycetota bacterium]